MPSILDGLTEREQKLARGMAAAIWGIDLDKVQPIEARSQCNKLCIPVLIPRPLKWTGESEETYIWDPHLTDGPAFRSEVIELDRWLVPWRLKAGYSAEIDVLVYRLEVTQ